MRKSHFSAFWPVLPTAARAAVVIALSVVLLGLGWWKWQSLVIGDSEAGAPEFWPDARYNQDIQAIINNFRSVSTS